MEDESETESPIQLTDRKHSKKGYPGMPYYYVQQLTLLLIRVTPRTRTDRR